ncbi:DnaJ C-terminal domain-containing protein [Actinomadura decatromicini]|uniref:DnaJ domain-containing protein n=1 Tax=Actinomadura decatromicini TaxID=2604572 RepID=A0A5D3F8E4_9ACTN|nr:DnaJ C-terminal domain-containing protein [Actinomadura decatromicini]TYK44096.1 DnaJ domain-containing protein [Actinomadura decatromicini]
MTVQDPYAALGVSRDADQDEIQRAYRKLARAHHPDINKDPDAEETFKDVSEAYAILSDPEQRRRYDAFGPDFRRVPEDADPDMWARSRAGAAAGRTGPYTTTGGVYTGGSGEDIDFEELFGGIFGGRRRGGGRWSTWSPSRGADQETEIEISVEEAYRGTRRTITLQRPEGRQNLDVTVPAGVTDGQRIRLAGQGGSGDTTGDLYLVVRIAPHPRYRVEGRDVYTDLPLAPWEAALGTTVGLRTPGGEAKVKVPPGTSSGRRLRLRGRGLPNPRGAPGDLFAEVRIVVPAEPSETERRLLEELASASPFDPRRS